MLFLAKSSVRFFVVLWCCQVLNGLKPIEKLVHGPSSYVMEGRSAPDCGFKATVTNIPGKLTSPNYPNSYPPDKQCNWQLTAVNNAGKILLKIKQFSIEEFTDCGSDYLAIYDKKSNTLVRKLCGKVHDEEIAVNSNKVLLVFKSDSNFEQKGFYIEYSLASNTCDQKLIKSQGSIFSPWFPLGYPSDLDCYYWITVPNSDVIFFTFQHLELEFHRRCAHDYVAIYDGPTPESPLLGRFCDKTLRSQVRSTNNSVLVHFHSNEVNNEPGFALSYNTNGFIWENGSVGHCKWSANEKGGVISSPNYPRRYPSQSVCKIEITAPDDHVVKFTFTHLDLEPDANCGYDDITIKEVLTIFDERIVDVLCGKPQMPLSVLTTRNIVQFSFKSDGFNEFSGFTLKYQYRRATPSALPARSPIKPIAPIAVAAPGIVSSIKKINTMCGLPTKGQPTVNDEKIVGGSNAKKGAHPWQVMLWDRKYHAFCGGVLLNERWFVSAAHCFHPEFTKLITWSHVRIRLGKLDQGEVESEEFSTTIDQINIHHNYNRYSNDNDIAVVRVKDFVRFTDYIMPICLGDPKFIEQTFFKDNNIRGIVTGWGAIKELGAAPRILKELEIPLVKRETCLQSTPRKVTPNMFCAGYAEEAIGDTCQGDSGGPLIAKFRGRWYLPGITSFGVGCNRKGHYGFYTKVNNYHQWILDTIYEPQIKLLLP